MVFCKMTEENWREISSDKLDLAVISNLQGLRWINDNIAEFPQFVDFVKEKSRNLHDSILLDGVGE